MLQTDRIKLIPLTYKQLVKYFNCDTSLEEELDLNQTKRTISKDLREALEETILRCVADSTKNYLFATLWTVIDIEKKQMVADVCFKGEPNENGELEIGYGTYENFQGNGFMTEAVRLISEWAFEQPNVLYVVAETEKFNRASAAVLLKNNFEKIDESEHLVYWRFEKGKNYSQK